MCYSYLLTFILIAWLDFIILCIILCLMCSIYVPVRRWSHLQEKDTVVPSERLSFINSHTMCMSCILQWLVHRYNSSNSLTNFFIFFLSYPVVAQDYVTEAENEYVIRGNSAVMKCKIPSFVSDFVSIDAWVSEDNVELSVQTASHDYGNLVPDDMSWVRTEWEKDTDQDFPLTFENTKKIDIFNLKHTLNSIVSKLSL